MVLSENILKVMYLSLKNWNNRQYASNLLLNHTMLFLWNIEIKVNISLSSNKNVYVSNVYLKLNNAQRSLWEISRSFPGKRDK